ncbi:MAG: hypothetical protein GKR88_14850 [Flavobacteriaceae bacterium]|nr:MAG: hypothetical protein GKR88_07980 [Flavobacteriaceae bacterium]QMU65435.1 MAG: hypothetical protein GKR88_14850 [Flavobacteriaceae bacterium]
MMKHSLLILVIVFNIHQLVYSQSCSYTIEIMYEPGRKLVNGKSEYDLPKQWKSLGGVKGGTNFFFLKYEAFLKDANTLSNNKRDRWNKIVITNKSKFEVGLNLKWKNQSSGGRAYIKPGGSYTFESNIFDKPYATAEINKVTFKFNKNERKKYGTYETKYLKCLETAESVINRLSIKNQVQKSKQNNKEDDFWSGKKESKKATSNINRKDDFWSGGQSNKKAKQNNDENFWSGKGNQKEEDYFKQKTKPKESNQFIGEINSNTKYIRIVCKDHGSEDGDRVALLNNKSIVESNIYLTNSPKTFKIQLKWGMNRIDFKALNQGTAGPNTAKFDVYDDTGKLISSKEWNLLTGFTGTLLITKF